MHARDDEEIRVYSTESRIRKPGEVLRQMGRGLLGCRYLAYRLFLKDLKAEYVNAKWGFVWDLLEPLVMSLIFMVLLRINVVAPGKIHMPFALFVTFGVMTWTTFSEAILKPMDVIKYSKPLIMHTRVTPEALLVSQFYRMMFNASFRVAIMVGMALALRSYSVFGLIGFVALSPAVVLAGMAFGVFMAPFHAIYNDVGRVTRILLKPLMYASPVMYGMERLNALVDGHTFWGNCFVDFAKYNPISVTLVFLRDLAASGAPTNGLAFAVTMGYLLVVLLVGWFVFNMSITILAERA